jgi:undecaprenyl diphosphate synthase
MKCLKQKIPKHVAMVMDGNGRWAENKGLSRSEGHRAGLEVVKRIIQASIEHGIPVISLWAFGRDNWSRPQSEVDYLMQLLSSALEMELEALHKNEVRLLFTGNRTELSPALQEAIDSAEHHTQHNTRLTLNIVFNYGGKWDIVEGAKKLVRDVLSETVAVQDIDESLFARYLNAHDLPDPDFFIRTSGEQRISNFFLWQLAYTELYFSELCWPDFTIEAYSTALKCFADRERRYGKTSQQLNESSHA